MRVLAIIPARGGSKRLPGKNIRPLQGKPLIQWSLDFAASVPWFDAIELSTDDTDIAACAIDIGYPVSRLRPLALATDEASSLDVVTDVLAWKAEQGERFDLVALLQPTTPARDAKHWEQALAHIQAGADAAIGIAAASDHPNLTYRASEDGALTSFLPVPVSLRSQDLAPAFVINGALYLVRVEALLQYKTFFPPHSRGVIMDLPWHNLDIDTAFDWQYAEWVLQNFYETT